MKNTIKMMVISLIAAFAVFSAQAATNCVVNCVEKTSLFNAKEFGVSFGSGYVVDTSAAFQQDYSLNLNGGLFYYPYRNLGFEANLPLYQSKGVSVSEVQVGLVARLPIGHLAPYVSVGGVYSWSSDTEWAYLAKCGLEWRFNPKWGVFAEYQYRNTDFNWGKGSSLVNGGIRLVF